MIFNKKNIPQKDLLEYFKRSKKMIKNIEDLKKIQIVCRNQNQVKDCLNYLKQLGFDVEDFTEYCDGCNIIFWGDSSKKFIISNMLKINLPIEFYNKEFVKTLQKFIKEKQEKEKVEDFEVAEDGRITKINNLESEQKIYTIYGTETDLYHLSFVNEMISLGSLYATAEARDRAKFKMETEIQIKNIAERLNKEQKIDWEDARQEKFSFFYNYESKTLDWWGSSHSCQKQGTIYCLDRNFLEVAKQEIGEDNLIKYFKD
jgi:hypothetical protein